VLSRSFNYGTSVKTLCFFWTYFYLLSIDFKITNISFYFTLINCFSYLTRGKSLLESKPNVDSVRTDVTPNEKV
jgi:hypothetical protein